jgi:hypothetical protein
VRWEDSANNTFSVLEILCWRKPDQHFSWYLGFAAVSWQRVSFFPASLGIGPIDSNDCSFLHGIAPILLVPNCGNSSDLKRGGFFCDKMKSNGIAVCLAIGVAFDALFSLALSVTAVTGSNSPSSVLLVGFRLIFVILSVLVLIFAIRLWTRTKPNETA